MTALRRSPCVARDDASAVLMARALARRLFHGTTPEEEGVKFL